MPRCAGLQRTTAARWACSPSRGSRSTRSSSRAGSWCGRSRSSPRASIASKQGDFQEQVAILGSGRDRGPRARLQRHGGGAARRAAAAARAPRQPRTAGRGTDGGSRERTGEACCRPRSSRRSAGSRPRSPTRSTTRSPASSPTRSCCIRTLEDGRTPIRRRAHAGPPAEADRARDAALHGDRARPARFRARAAADAHRGRRQRRDRGGAVARAQPVRPAEHRARHRRAARCRPCRPISASSPGAAERPDQRLRRDAAGRHAAACRTRATGDGHGRGAG